jgi:hypothetical protein
MKMTDHQSRLWQSMIDEIQLYLDGATEDFYDLVGRLEGALDASEIQDKLLVDQWYDFWMPLEIRRSIEGNNVDRKKVVNELTNMKTFLLKNK